MQRVIEAGNAAAAGPSAHDASDPGELAQLRAQLQTRISSEKLARMVAENPLRAQNEVRSICTQLFDEGRVASAAGMDVRQREALVGALIDSVFGFGPIEGLLADAAITEVMVNGVDSIYYERDGVLHRSEASFATEDEVRSLIDRIIGPLGRRIDESSPMVNARLDDGSRVHAVIPPLSLVGPVLTIRRFSPHVITLREMAASGTMDERLARFLAWAVRARVNIAVSGGTGTGKTTLLNALSCEIPHAERVITIEDSAELRFLEHPHVVRLEARPRNAEGTGEVTIRDLVTNALRMRPDRIVVGECRGAEALDMLQAMNTGHDGSLTTLHANSPEDAVLRLMTMVRYAADLPVDVIERQIASAIDLGVQLTRDAAGMRYVSQVVEYRFDQREGRACADPVFERPFADDPGRWLRKPGWFIDLQRKGVATEGEVRAWQALAS